MKPKTLFGRAARRIIDRWMLSGAERRRGARIDARLWVRVVGLDDEPVLRRGDISMTGIFVELDKPVGPLGAVKTLHIAPVDRRGMFEVACRVARVVMVQDIWRGDAVAGVAFEFIAENPDAEVHLHDLIRRLFVSEGEAAPAELTNRAPAPALAVEGISLHTRAALAVGEQVRVSVELPALGQRAQVQGNVVNVKAHPSGGFVVEVSTPRDPDVAPLEGPSIGDAFDVLLDGLLLPGGDGGEARVEGQHLTGSLVRIHLPSLLTWFDMERLSGVLRMKRGITQVTLYLQQGRLLDAELAGEPVPVRSLLVDLVTWKEGEFDFQIGKVEREDRVKQSTSALLLDAVRQLDEDKRGGE